jgi:hypothetical protein
MSTGLREDKPVQKVRRDCTQKKKSPASGAERGAVWRPWEEMGVQSLWENALKNAVTLITSRIEGRLAYFLSCYVHTGSGG